MELPNITPLQKKTAQQIVNIHETGSLDGDYSNVSVIASDAAQMCYGRPQAALANGSLGTLVADYCEARAAHAIALRPYVQRLQARDGTLVHEAALRCALAVAGVDPVMRRLQDELYDRLLWQPALES